MVINRKIILSERSDAYMIGGQEIATPKLARNV